MAFEGNRGHALERRRCRSWISRVCTSVHGDTGNQRHCSAGTELRSPTNGAGSFWLWHT